MPTEPRKTRRLAWSAGLGIAVLAAAGLFLARGGEAGSRAAPAAPPPSSGPQFLGSLAEPGGLPIPDGREERRRQLVEQVQQTDQAYCSYLEGSRYPQESQPAARNPDQAYPNQPVMEMHPMRMPGGGSSDRVLLQTSQSRVYLAAGEAVAFSLRAVDPKGQTVPLVVTRALAQGMTYRGQRASAQVTLPFADDGGGADQVAGDGAFAGVLAPAQTGLAGFHGTIRTEVRYNAGGRSGFALFDVIYTPSLPAAWTGQVREATENGSLNFYLRLDVRQPGRYVVTGRVDDARGKPFALATFNDLLGQGPQDVKLMVFGKLLLDGAPQLPLVLRDVDGYLLRENLDPDRLLIPRLEGKVYASKTGSPKGFSDAEWQSEERSRYLAEYGKDRNEARARLAAFDPGQALPPGGCAQPGK